MDTKNMTIANQAHAAALIASAPIIGAAGPTAHNSNRLIYLERPAGENTLVPPAGATMDQHVGNAWSGRENEIWQRYALPVGNGRIGAMVYGDVERERIQFTLDSLWSGRPVAEPNRANSLVDIERIRALLLENKYTEAAALADETLGSHPEARKFFGSLVTFGDLFFDTGIPYGAVEDYGRELDLDRAVATVAFDYHGRHYTRTVFASYPDRCLVVRFEVSNNGTQDIALSFRSPRQLQRNEKDGQWRFSGRLPDSGMEIEARIAIRHDGGALTSDVQTLRVQGARTVDFILVADTDYDPEAPGMVGKPLAEWTARRLAAAERKGFEPMLAAHVADHQSLYRRVEVDFGKTPDDVLALPMDQRLARYKRLPDPELEATLFQYGRYLMIASSRPGTLPANLQGVWNNRDDPPWMSDYHLNINLQMNYWLAGPANLLECQEPLIDYLERLVRAGRGTARAYFESEAWTTFHLSNIWGYTAPSRPAGEGSLTWKWSPLCGPWLAHHAYEHHTFGQDREMLETRLWPILAGTADFVADYLVHLPDGTYTAMPTWSPEHGTISKGATFEIAVAREVLKSAQELARELGIDTLRTDRWREVMESLLPYTVGRHGQLQEWLEDRDDPKDEHRHLNHLFGLHPGTQISPLTTPELAEAARVTLVHRGDEGTGWSLAWKINFWARMRRPDKAHLLLRNLLKMNIHPNLLSTHPPFQIDGNLGATAGIAEMLLQSHERDSEGRRILDILPALPDAWPEGSVRGLMARGGFEIDTSWEHGNVKTLRVRSRHGHDFALRLNGCMEVKAYSLAKDDMLELTFQIHELGSMVKDDEEEPLSDVPVPGELDLAAMVQPVPKTATLTLLSESATRERR